MELDNVKQWINVPMTNLPYVMKNIAGNEVWQTLSSQTEITNIETDVANLQVQVNNLVINDLQDVDTQSVPPVNAQTLIYDDGLNQWIPGTLPNPASQLSSLTDVALGSLNNNDLLTYDQANDKWINKVKPDYTIEEMKDYDSSVAKLDNDFMSWNLSKNKWEPKTFDLEVENYFSL